MYDYQADRLIKRVVNLGDGKLAGSYTATKMQPPAAAREVSTALNLLLSAPLGKDLKERYAQVTGQQFTAPSQVRVTAHIYRGRPADTGAWACGAHRCLQLVVQVPDGPFLDLNHIVVDLSGRTVARLR